MLMENSFKKLTKENNNSSLVRPQRKASAIANILIKNNASGRKDSTQVENESISPTLSEINKISYPIIPTYMNYDKINITKKQGPQPLSPIPNIVESTYQTRKRISSRTTSAKNSPIALSIPIKSSDDKSSLKRGAINKNSKIAKVNKTETMEQNKLIIMHDRKRLNIIPNNHIEPITSDLSASSYFKDQLRPIHVKESDLDAEFEPRTRILLTRADGRRNSFMEMNNTEFHSLVNRVGERMELKLINREVEKIKHQEYTEKVIKEQEDYYKYNQRNPVGLQSSTTLLPHPELIDKDYHPSSRSIPKINNNTRKKIQKQLNLPQIIKHPQMVNLNQFSQIARKDQPNFFYKLLDDDFVTKALKSPKDFDLKNFDGFQFLEKN